MRLETIRNQVEKLKSFCTSPVFCKWAVPVLDRFHFTQTFGKSLG